MPDDATDKSVEWTSENPEIATVSDNGTITGKSYGRTVVNRDYNRRRIYRKVCGKS